MKIIELLNKIANGEEVPKQIIYCGVDYYWTNFTYENPEAEETLFWFDVYSEEHLNDEIEIIEEDKKIEKIKSLNNVGNCQDIIEFEDKQQLNNHILKDKINEIIDCINRGDKK